MITKEERRLETLFKNGHWCKYGSGKIHIKGKGMCYCLSIAVCEHYRFQSYEIRDKLIKTIEELFPERTSEFALRMAQVNEPMVTKKYSLVTFNDHPDTTLEDIIKVCHVAHV